MYKYEDGEDMPQTESNLLFLLGGAILATSWLWIAELWILMPWWLALPASIYGLGACLAITWFGLELNNAPIVDENERPIHRN